MKEEINVLIKEDEIVARVKELAEQINRDYEGKTLHLICILKGSVFFTCELAKYITVPVTIDFMSVSSYGNSMTSSGSITISQDLIMSLENREVLIIEDIVDSGRTLSYLAHMLEKRGPKSLRICTLLNRHVAYQKWMWRIPVLKLMIYLWLDLDLIMPRNTAICLISES